MIASAAGCGGGPPPLNLPPHAMVLRLADVDDVPTLDPAAGYDTASWTFEQAIFDTLVRYGDGNIELEPDIATSWESSPDATTFTFHMRGDARFSDGRAVTSEDFRYGVERVLNPATRSRGWSTTAASWARRISSRIARRTSAASKRPIARRSFSI